jgi:hypothetical protein
MSEQSAGNPRADKIIQESIWNLFDAENIKRRL